MNLRKALRIRTAIQHFRGQAAGSIPAGVLQELETARNNLLSTGSELIAPPQPTVGAGAMTGHGVAGQANQ
jgi:hypothetical protein